jgi:CHASE3 domain sensor protein
MNALLALLFLMVPFLLLGAVVAFLTLEIGSRTGPK